MSEDRTYFANRMGISLQEAEWSEYLGDGVYMWPDGYHLWLGTLEGQKIALEPNLFDKLNEYRQRMIQEKQVPEK